MTSPHPSDGPQTKVPRRAIHLDFHTGPTIPNVGADFEPASFARTFADAGVDSVTVFAKCHHGMLYLDTDHPARHPGLRSGLDLVAEQVRALHAVGLRAPIYLSVLCDEYAADQHPEWLAVTPDLRQVKWSDSTFDAGWQILDLSSPYQDYLADQLDLVLDRLDPVDGVFLDMCWDQPSVSRWALDGMRRSGLNSSREDDRLRYARQVTRSALRRFADMINSRQPDGKPVSIFFNSRPRVLADEERDLITHEEIESLPSGGWGYRYLPYVGRVVRGYGLPAAGMTARFQESWGDNAGLKPVAALMYECTQSIALGFGVSVGDALHPGGAPHPDAYRMIGEVFDRLALCEPYTADAVVRTEIAVLAAPDLEVARTFEEGPDAAQAGAITMLQQLRHQFDVVTPGAELSGYRVVVVPESTDLRPFGSAVLDYVGDGGRLLITTDGDSIADRTELLARLGVAHVGRSPYTHTFIRPGAELRGNLRRQATADTPVDSDIVVYERGLSATAAPGATVLAEVVEPYFERRYDRFCGHDYTPPGRLGEDAAIITARVGEGEAITVAEPLFGSFGRHANVAHRELIERLLARLLPDPLIRVGGPVHLETAVHQQEARTVVHLVSFLPGRHGDRDLVTDPFPLVDVELSVRTADRPRTVRSEPQGIELPYTHRDGYVTTRVDVADGHALIVLE